MTNTNKTVLAIVAHPDDAEISCAGTLALLKDKGWNVVMATMTPGDCGTTVHSRAEISKIRKQEAADAAAMLDADYHCLECDDVFVMYDRETIIKAIALIRKTKPSVVITMSPSCYMVDHEMTSKIIQTACFSAGIMNIVTEGLEPYFYTPHLYYVDAMEGKDRFGKPVEPGMIVDISSKIQLKEDMLACHASQRNWLRDHHGMDEYIIAMKSFGEKRGKEINASYGEGYRQHLGHAYPQNNILKEELGDLVHER
ncbi:PIG-L deacetylase family protein [Sphingobacterium hotanense]|uniref:PIG-L deacetylase family protein n=1 Tax=Sphingobacterium hotanense TaxID=649196 RepID=UPI0021A8B022|nr:PIG-L family deacetylase [Sphingobacterium hotanense]MCT1526327.1 PIG-L family deacetylase [Sphingobacterium hotanense]